MAYAGVLYGEIPVVISATLGSKGCPALRPMTATTDKSRLSPELGIGTERGVDSPPDILLVLFPFESLDSCFWLCLLIINVLEQLEIGSFKFPVPCALGDRECEME